MTARCPNHSLGRHLPEPSARYALVHGPLPLACASHRVRSIFLRREPRFRPPLLVVAAISDVPI